MRDFFITRLAQADIEAIDQYIAFANPAAADLLLDDLYSAMQRAADDPPAVGLVRPDLTDRDVRFVLVRKFYWVVFVVGDNSITVIRVLHARRDLPDIL